VFVRPSSLLARNNRLSAAVGVSCGTGLLRVATTAALTTIFILRMGRKKKEHPVIDNRTVQQQQQQRHRSSLLSNNGTNPALMNSNSDVDDYGYANAEIHVTTHWDEHVDQEADDVDKKVNLFQSEFPEARHRFIAAASQKQQGQVTEMKEGKKYQSYCMETNNSTVLDDHLIDPSELMEEIVRSAWKKDNETVTTLVDIALNQIEQSDRVSKRNLNPRDTDYHP
jgi:hypothetical protein